MGEREKEREREREREKTETEREEGEKGIKENRKKHWKGVKRTFNCKLFDFYINIVSLFRIMWDNHCSLSTAPSRVSWRRGRWTYSQERLDTPSPRRNCCVNTLKSRYAVNTRTSGGSPRSSQISQWLQLIPPNLCKE